MDLNTYQARARDTAVYRHSIEPRSKLTYTILGLCSEAGEVASVMKKHLRDGTTDLALKARMSEELGDCLWYIAMVADELGLPLDNIATANIIKLDDRKTRGKLGGSGDHR